MSYTDPKLLKIASEGGKFLKIGVGESFTGRYGGYSTKLDEKYKKMKVVFKLKDKDGKVKELATSSKKVLAKFAKVAPGSIIKLVKLGDGTDTDYSITIIKAAKMAAVEDEVEDDEVEIVEEETVEEVDAEDDTSQEDWPEEADDVEVVEEAAEAEEELI